MLCSIHTPKTGGISFKNILDKYYSEKLFLDYGDYPINVPIDVRHRDLEEKKSKVEEKEVEILSRYDCIHGHYMPYKYKSLLHRPDVYFVTWLRDPLERLASHYYFWFRAYHKDRAAELHRKVVLENWSFEKFCFSEEMRNLYAQFFWSFPIEGFDFIGITEYFDEDLCFFSEKFLGMKLEKVPNENSNPNRKSYFQDKKMIEDLREFHSMDYQIYYTALRMREDRINLIQY